MTLSLRMRLATLAPTLALALAASPSGRGQRLLPARAPAAAHRIARPLAPAALWHDPGDISSLNLAFGQGGFDDAPLPESSYSFIKEDLNGSSPKVYVRDQNGTEWLVKVGDEARGETAATRLVWAMGYFTDEDYFVARLYVSHMPHLDRKSHSVQRDGTVANARLERHIRGQKKLGNWDWGDNPFSGSREMNGLRVLMALINNWDLKSVNNKIYTEKDRSVRYVVADLGASFGRTGGVATRSKGKLRDYAKDRFIRQTGDDTVDFVMRTKPSWLLKIFKPKYYRERVAMAEIVRQIPRSDARWIGEQLSRLTTEQIRSAFLASGFTTRESDGYTDELKERIAELCAL